VEAAVSVVVEAAVVVVVAAVAVVAAVTGATNQAILHVIATSQTHALVRPVDQVNKVATKIRIRSRNDCLCVCCS